MSKAIGFRVEPSAIHYAIVEGTSEDPVLIDDGRYAAPKDYSEGEALTWYRDRTAQLFEEAEPSYGGIKFMESVGFKNRPPAATDSLRRRHRIEGVILQLLDECGVDTVAGAFATVASELGTKSAKKYIGGEELRGLDWSEKTKLVKEAILTATAALPSEI